MSSLITLARGCLHCPKAFCSAACPLHNPISEALSLYEQGQIEAAAKLIYERNPFPELTGALCERFCAKNCVKHRLCQPIAFSPFESEIAQYPDRRKKKEPTAKHIAIIGAGPAGLAYAYKRLLNGDEVTVYDRYPSIGGALYAFIPDFRFDKKILDQVAKRLTDRGCHFILGQEVKGELKGYDHVVYATGAYEANLAGFKLSEKIAVGLDLLYGLKHGDLKLSPTGSYFIYGGGNVALDCLRSLARLGLDVTLVYRRSELQMPGDKEQLMLAEKEGAKTRFLTVIDKVEGDQLLLKKCELGPLGEDGRRSFKVLEEGSELVPFAKLYLCLGERSSRIEGRTYIGDAAIGSSNVAAAIGSALALD